MRLGLVGVGRFGRRYLQTLATLPGLNLVAVASRNPTTSALLPADCALFSDWQDLLDTASLDGLMVVTPPRTHAAIVAAAVQRGIAVLVEKPLTLDVDEAERLLAMPACAPVMVEHTHLFSPAYATLRASLQGDVCAIETDAGGDGPLRADVPVLWDWGAHWVALCLHLLRCPPDVCRCLLEHERRDARGIGQSLQLELEFGAVAATLRLSNLLRAPRRRLTVSTSAGQSLVYDELAQSPLTLTDATGGPRPLPVGAERPLREALLAFHQHWRDWQRGEVSQPESGLRLGVEVVRTLARCEMATTGP